MAKVRTIEIFSAGCTVCEEAVVMINKIACPSCDVRILEMHEPEVAKKAKRYGIRSVPAVAIDGKLVDCCAGRGPNEAVLHTAGIGAPL
jgi:glutaredoxin 3